MGLSKKERSARWKGNTKKEISGLNEENYLRILRAQGGVCAVCKKIPSKRFAIDHDHNTGKIRGLICPTKCNLALGSLRDDPEVVKQAWQYLSLHSIEISTILVGLGNKARSGKDTFAGMVHSRLPSESKIYSFANALKAYARVSSLMKQKDGPLLQIVGTEVFRRSDPGFWIRMLAYQIQEEAPKIALIPDMRFPDEKEWVEKNGISIKVIRLKSNGNQFISPDRPANHPSEVALDNSEFDYSFSAKDGDFRTLENAADTIAEILKVKLHDLNKRNK